MKTFNSLSLFQGVKQPDVESQKTQTLTSTTDLSTYQKRILQYENMHLLEGVQREGPLGMPKAQPVYIEHYPTEYVPFSNLKSCTSTHVGVHFFIYDYLFKCIWSRLEFYLNKLKKYDLVISTDDSVFLDFPLIDNLRNVYKSRVFTVVGQKMGVNVVPTFSCGNPNDIDFYCDGLPEGGCIAVGGMGTNSSRGKRALFKYCVEEMCKRKHPDQLLIYGSDVKLDLNIPIVRIPTFVEQLRAKTVK